MHENKWDVFISYASEDKETIARPLARSLQERRLSVWFDEDVLEVGDSLFRSINYGLANSTYGVVILSPQYLAKAWPQIEIGGLIQLATANEKKILPVWHNLSRQVLIHEYPTLADSLAVLSDEGLEAVVEKIVRAIGRGTAIPTDTARKDYRDYVKKDLFEKMLRDDPTSGEALYQLDRMEGDADGWFHHELRMELERTISTSTRSAKERARAGAALARLGDRRFRPDAWFLPDENQLGFVQIPAGFFPMGTDQSPSRRNMDRESPEHPYYVPTFYVGRYPVTVAQYRVFLLETHSKTSADAGLTGPDNHPMVSVSWYEAMQYCQWLDERLRTWSSAPRAIADLLQAPGNTSAWILTLPSEAEWEKAARGDKDSRIFPWGPQSDPERANFYESGLGSTSTVGCFEAGSSPFGIQDTSGNTWEWTRGNLGRDVESPQFKYPYLAYDGREDTHAPESVFRVIRGGAFCSPSEDIRCSCRRAELPKSRYNHLGFRLAITPTY